MSLSGLGKTLVKFGKSASETFKYYTDPHYEDKKKEKQSWYLHYLSFDEKLRQEQLNILDNLFKIGSKLETRVSETFCLGVNYTHYYLTTKDGLRIDFSPDNQIGCVYLGNNSTLATKAFTDTIVFSEFVLTDVVMDRIQQLCGITKGYSHCLRNSEHFTNYIRTGDWISSQSVNDSIFKTLLYELGAFDDEDFIKHRNMLPEPLANESKHQVVSMWPGDNKALTFCEKLRTIGDDSKQSNIDRKETSNSRNILLIGPSGAGKSHIINMLHNLTICRSVPSLNTNTRKFEIVSSNRVNTTNEKINIIDASNICNSDFSNDDILRILRRYIKSESLYVDRVVIVCRGVIFQHQRIAIMNILKLLNYEKNPDKFRIVYNIMDEFSSYESKYASRIIDRCLSGIADMFKIDKQNCICLGLSRNKTYLQLEDEYKKLVRTMLDDLPKNDDKLKIAIH